TGIAVVALLLSVVVALHLARVVVWPLRALMRGVEAIRQGEFDQRIAPAADDELGRLADGINRMAEDVAEFRRSNLSEVVRVKEPLGAVLAALPDAVLLVDAKERVSPGNAAASRLLASLGGADGSALGAILPADAARGAVGAALRGDGAK